ncbi:MAG: rRNA maturation RNase YbeY [Dehalococcoidales bacterium]|nr:rRNA maturation RNase YbeY [Dehalococcoidales bacterium]
MARQLELILVADIPSPWEEKAGLPSLTAAAEAALRRESVEGMVEVVLSVVDDEEIRELNARYRQVDAPTDVLSFPLQEAPAGAGDFVQPPDDVLRLGDVVISLPRAEAQAEEYGHSLARELGYLFVHGLLHLLGYEHELEEGRLRMREREEAALAEAGLSR